MPLVLLTVTDHNGITSLVGGALISDETCDSYEWVLQQLKECTETEPKVLFTDGDVKFAKAIASVFPKTVHLLCRLHISHNITRKLAAKL
jgi:transposase-like protein